MRLFNALQDHLWRRLDAARWRSVRRPSQRMLRIEPLEVRKLLTLTSVSFDGGAMTIYDSSDSNEFYFFCESKMRGEEWDFWVYVSKVAYSSAAANLCLVRWVCAGRRGERCDLALRLSW